MKKNKEEKGRAGKNPRDLMDSSERKTAEDTLENRQEATEEPVEPEEKRTDEESPPLSEKCQECSDLTDRLQRVMAEFDNYRKRTAKEKAAMYNEGLRDTVEKLLPVLDNFERALQQASGFREEASASEERDSFYKGFELILKQMQGFLKDLGIEPVPGVGERFDPRFHFAVSHVEDETRGESEIIEELQKGYRHQDKVIRTSMVKVAN